MSAELIGPAEFLTIKDVAHHLIEVHTELIQTEYELIILKKYQSSHFAEIILWFDPKGNIIKQYMCLYGLISEWNLVDGVRTGALSDTDGTGEYDQEPMLTTIRQACDFVRIIDCIELQQLSAIQNNMLASPTMQSLDPIEFLHKYGRTEIKKAPGFFKPIWDAVSYLFKSKI